MASDRSKRSRARFQQINIIVDEVFRKLPTGTHQAALVVAWRDADDQGRFRMSTSQFAEVLGLSKRRAVDVVSDLVKIGAIKVLKKATGRRAPVYMITLEPKDVAVNSASPQENADPP